MNVSPMRWAFCLVCAVALFSCGDLLAQSASLSGVPDFSQYADANWQNFCAPTTAADVVYYFSNSFPSLRQGNNFGPGPSQDSGATNIIAGTTAPSGPPLAGTIGDLMSTTTAGGTTLTNLAGGLDTYLEMNDGVSGGSNWATQTILAGDVGGSAFWSMLQSNISNGNGVILTVGWQGLIPMGYDTPDDYNYSSAAGAPMGHALTMVGFDLNTSSIFFHDPADSGTTHMWPSVTAASATISVNANDLSITIAGQTATVYGAVVTSIPEPGMALLFPVGLVILAWRRSSRKI